VGAVDSLRSLRDSPCCFDQLGEQVLLVALLAVLGTRFFLLPILFIPYGVWLCRVNLKCSQSRQNQKH
jgi:hypothetical protein